MTTNSIVATIRLILIPIFVVVLIVGAGGQYLLLRHYAIAEATEDARLVLNTALAIREYTEQEVLPDLSKAPSNQFYETSVPAFAAQSIYRRVQSTNPAYSYRESALNPTSPNDRPTPVEVDLINRFRADPNLNELTGIREGDSGAVFYLARPIRITDADCLRCHSTPEAAPAALIAKYGSTNGFGWHVNETIGVQMLTVPIVEKLKSSVELAVSVAGGLLVAFIVMYFAITYALFVTIVRPLRDLAMAAKDASVSTNSRMVMASSGASELQDLADSIRRLRESLLKSLRRLSSGDSAPQN